MSVTAADLAEFVGKKVTIVHNLAKANDKGETAEELEGTLVAAAGDAVMFKPKGKTNATLIDVASIESITYAQEKAKALTRKSLKVVKHGQARAHLLERHSYTLGEINQMGETEAFEMHAGIDHITADLGHDHRAKEDKPESEDTDED